MIKILTNNKVLLAVGHRGLENFIETQLENEFIFVGNATYKEAIIRVVGQKNPNIIIIRETLEGTEDLESIIYELRTRYPNIRIIFVGGNRRPGDELLTKLVSYGIYDILYGTKIPAHSIVNLIRKANTYVDVKEFHPLPNLSNHSTKDGFEVQAKKDEVVQPVQEIKMEKKDEKEEDKKQDKQKVSIMDKFSKKEDESIKSVEPIKPVETIKPAEEPETEKKEKVKKEVKPKRSKKKKEEKEEKEVNEGNDDESFFSGMFKPKTKHSESNKEKIITFIGGQNGVGTSTIAFSSAVSLANEGKKVIYIELDDATPSTSYIYEMGDITKGIDSCLDAIYKNKFKLISDAIIKTEDLQSSNKSIKGYKKLPKTLDYLFFSKSYIASMKKEVNLKGFKELFLYIKYQLGYDYVVIDVSLPLSNIASQDAIVYSDDIVSVISQDITSVGYHLFDLDSLETKGFNIKEKITYVINQYIPCKFGSKEIKQWINTENINCVTLHNKDLIEYNYKGEPLVLAGRRNVFKDEINNLVEKIK